jgi:hypothetical protein
MAADRHTETEINLSNNRHNFLTEYQGQLSSAQLAAMSIQNFTQTSVTFSSLPSVSTATVVFRAGDWIQPALSRYPYIVTQQVTRGSGSQVTATVHRSLITSENTTTTGTFVVGTATTIMAIVATLPTVKIVDRDWAEFSGDFVLIESIK